MNAAGADWRTVVRAAAAAQAEAEARRVWQLTPDAPIPFNHRWEHVVQVAGLAQRLGTELGADLEIVEAAAWLHDVRKGEPSHGMAGAAAAAQILGETDFPPAKIGAVADAIRRHVGLHRAPGAPPLTPLEAAVLWDADKLTKLGVQALAFSLGTTYAAYKTLAERYEDNLRFVGDVLSKTAVSMNTAPAQALAARRYSAMVAMLETWAAEARESEDVG